MSASPLALGFDVGEEEGAVIALATKFGQSLRHACRRSEAEGIADFADRWADLGLAELHWPESAGGLGLGLRLKMQVLETLGHADAAAALALDRRAWVYTPLLGLGLDRPAARSPACYVDLDGRLIVDGGRVRGSLPYLPQADCDALIVLAGRTLHVVTEGLALRPVDVGALNALGASSAAIDGPSGSSHECSPGEARWVAASWRLPLAALLVGLSRAAYEYARDYCLERVAFGRKVAHHQAVAFLFSDMAIAVEAAGLMVAEAALRADRQPRDTTTAGVLDRAYLQAAECALVTTNHALQLVGGAGYMRDHLVEKWMREARALTLLAGGADGATEVAAEAALETVRAPP